MILGSPVFRAYHIIQAIHNGSGGDIREQLDLISGFRDGAGSPFEVLRWKGEEEISKGLFKMTHSICPPVIERVKNPGDRILRRKLRG
jgi:hypothetical protein